MLSSILKKCKKDRELAEEQDHKAFVFTYPQLEFANYLPFLVESVHSVIINSEGWTKLLHELFDDLFEREFGLKPVKDRVWASEYENGRRKVVSVFMINDLFATFKWGWNYKFVPRESGNKAVWCRTDKSIYMHTYEIPQAIHHVSSEREARTLEKMTSNVNDIISGYTKLVDNHKSVFEATYDEIKEYFLATDTYENMLLRIEQDMSHHYYRWLIYENPIAYAFVEKYLGYNEKAEEDFKKIIFKNESIKNDFYKKFKDINKV